MYACAGGHVDTVKELLTYGANVEDHNENGHTPLMEAASAGHVMVAKVLCLHYNTKYKLFLIYLYYNINHIYFINRYY